MADAVATYSICACDLEAGQWGVATQSKFLAVGSVVPWAAPHVGAIATQSYANPRYGPDGLALLREGLSAEEVMEQLTGADEDRELRQLGVVDREGRAATFTGSGCHAWAGGRTGEHYAAQGNSSSPARRSTRWPRRSRRLRAGRSPNGSWTASMPPRRREETAVAASRPRSSSSSGTAATPDSPTYSWTSASTTTRIRSASSVACTGCTTSCSARRRAMSGSWWTTSSGELDRLLARVGHGTLADWAGVENLEERVDGDDEIDPVVLARLRESA